MRERKMRYVAIKCANFKIPALLIFIIQIWWYKAIPSARPEPVKNLDMKE